MLPPWKNVIQFFVALAISPHRFQPVYHYDDLNPNRVGASMKVPDNSPQRHSGIWSWTPALAPTVLWCTTGSANWMCVTLSTLLPAAALAVHSVVEFYAVEFFIGVCLFDHLGSEGFSFHHKHPTTKLRTQSVSTSQIRILHSLLCCHLRY